MTERKTTALILYNAFIRAGMTKVGACAMLGNAEAESAMRCNNVENRCPLSDEAYTEGVDNGTYYNFAYDAYGYGLFQWTHKSRKPGLLEMARTWGTSISDPYMQAAYAVAELEEKFPSVFARLKIATDLYAATKMVCEEYECPAVNNVAERYKYAKQYYDGFTKAEEIPDTPTQKPIYSKPTYYCTVKLPLLKKGMEDGAVVGLQQLLAAHGYYNGTFDGLFGEITKCSVMAFQSDMDLETDGEVGWQTWSKLIVG